MEIPLGLSVAHCELSLSKSGLIGVGVPVRVYPFNIPAPVTVAATEGPYATKP